jgi:hypothetical protein
MKKSTVTKNLKRILASMIAAAFILALCPVTSYAASKAPTLRDAKRTIYFFVTANDNAARVLYLDNIKNGDKLISAKSSNKKAATVDQKINNVKSTKENYIRLNKISPGNTKITVKIKRQNKTYTSSQNVKFLKYSNPVKSFKIGNKDYAKLLNKNFNSSIKTSEKKKVTVKGQNGWKVLWLHTYNYKNNKAVYGIKNGSTISMNKDTQVGARLEKTFGKEKVTVSVTLRNF